LCSVSGPPVEKNKLLNLCESSTEPWNARPMKWHWGTRLAQLVQEGHQEERARLFPVVLAGRMRDNGHKFKLDIMRSFYTMKQCPERLYHFHPWRFSRPDWRIPWATWFDII